MRSSLIASMSRSVGYEKFSSPAIELQSDFIWCQPQVHQLFLTHFFLYFLEDDKKYSVKNRPINDTVFTWLNGYFLCFFLLSLIRSANIDSTTNFKLERIERNPSWSSEPHVSSNCLVGYFSLIYCYFFLVAAGSVESLTKKENRFPIAGTKGILTNAALIGANCCATCSSTSFFVTFSSELFLSKIEKIQKRRPCFTCADGGGQEECGRQEPDTNGHFSKSGYLLVNKEKQTINEQGDLWTWNTSFSVNSRDPTGRFIFAGPAGPLG